MLGYLAECGTWIVLSHLIETVAQIDDGLFGGGADGGGPHCRNGVVAQAAQPHCRVEVGEEAHAKLQMIAGRRLQGTFLDTNSGEPMVGETIMYYSASHPRSGAG